MTRAKKYSLFLTLGTVLLLIMAACSTTGTSSQPVIQVLQKSSTAMKQLKSAHFETHASVTLKADLTGTPTSAAQKLSNLSFNVTTSGDEAMPDKASVHVTLGDNSLGLTGTYAAILLGDKLYIQNAAGQWYVLDKSVLQHDGKTTPGTNQPDLNKLLAAAEKAAK